MSTVIIFEIVWSFTFFGGIRLGLSLLEGVTKSVWDTILMKGPAVV